MPNRPFPDARTLKTHFLVNLDMGRESNGRAHFRQDLLAWTDICTSVVLPVPIFEITLQTEWQGWILCVGTSHKWFNYWRCNQFTMGLEKLSSEKFLDPSPDFSFSPKLG